MNRQHATTPVEVCAPDVDRVGPDASPGLPEWLVHVLALLILFLREHVLARRAGLPPLPSWCDGRPDLPLGSVQQLAASRRGAFGNAIAWMCLRRGIGPDHPDWPYLSRTIVAFGGSLKCFRPGLPAWGLQWWENPCIVPGMDDENAAAPAATATTLLLLQQEIARALPPVPMLLSADAARVVALAPERPVPGRAATGPPTGPPSNKHCQHCYA